MFQQLQIIGYLGADPTLRFLPDGSPVTTLSVATSEKYKDKETTSWFRVSVWGSQAEACNQYLKKGHPVLVIGRLNPDKETGGPRIYQRKDGTTGANYEVTATNVRFLPKSHSDVPGVQQEAGSTFDDGDIPF